MVLSFAHIENLTHVYKFVEESFYDIHTFVQIQLL